MVEHGESTRRILENQPKFGLNYGPSQRAMQGGLWKLLLHAQVLVRGGPCVSSQNSSPGETFDSHSKIVRSHVFFRVFKFGSLIGTIYIYIWYSVASPPPPSPPNGDGSDKYPPPPPCGCGPVVGLWWFTVGLELV